MPLFASNDPDRLADRKLARHDHNIKARPTTVEGARSRVFQTRSSWFQKMPTLETSVPHRKACSKCGSTRRGAYGFLSCGCGAKKGRVRGRYGY